MYNIVCPGGREQPDRSRSSMRVDTQGRVVGFDSTLSLNVAVGVVVFVVVLTLKNNWTTRVRMFIMFLDALLLCELGPLDWL